MTEAKAGETRGNRTTRVGKVVSDKMDRSVVVRVDRTVQDKRYKRYVRRKAQFMAHDENNVCKVGDKMHVKVLSIDGNRVKLSRKAALQEQDGQGGS